jgi:hypothetical protein
MRPLAQSERSARTAERVLDHPIAQRLPWHATEALLGIARGDTGIDPADARQLLHAALQVVVTAEVLSSREASR